MEARIARLLCWLAGALIVAVWGCASLGGGRSGAARSEGTPEDPLSVDAKGPHEGGVGPGGTSYYIVRPTGRVDIYIEVAGFEGEAELSYYGSDGGFSDWQGASQGDVLSAEDYFVESQTPLYFSIQDLTESGSRGLRYTIQVREEPYLDPIGIMVRGDIYGEAQELVSGREHRVRIGALGLEYYRVLISEGPVVTIQAVGLPEYARLVWFDTEDGDFESVMTETVEGEATRIQVSGVAPGTACLFYVVSPQAEVKAGDEFSILITEGAAGD